MKKSKKKLLTILLSILIAIPLVVILAVAGLFHAELRTIQSIEKEATNYYTMDYKADYGLDEFLKEGASNDSELASFVIKKLMKGLPVKITLPDLGCSAFQAQSPNGDYLFGRNFDNRNAIYALVHTNPKNGYESISMVNLSYIGYKEDYLPEGLIDRVLALAAPYIPLDGINEKGLSIGVLQLYTDTTNQDTEKIDITTTSAIRLILDKAATVEEAIELLSQYDMHSSANAPYHFQIADANGDSATVEYLDNILTVYRPEEGNLCTTNFVLSEGPYFQNGKGLDRWQILHDTLSQSEGILSEEEAMALLKSVAQNKTEEDGVFSGTLWSCLYNNTKCSLTLSCNQDYENLFSYTVNWK